jgi:ParB-like chromosome segregation protein Spo0J
MSTSVTTQPLAPPAKAALSHQPSATPTISSQSAAVSPKAELLTIPLGKIVPSKTNPRKAFDGPEMDELVESIRTNGVLQPVLVRKRVATPLDSLGKAFAAKDPNAPQFKDGETIYELVAGERRYRAATKAGLKEIPAMVRELTDQQVLEMQIVENLQRKDVTALEESAGYAQLFAAMQKESAKSAAAGTRADDCNANRQEYPLRVQPHEA